jgi:hypothetical protein
MAALILGFVVCVGIGLMLVARRFGVIGVLVALILLVVAVPTVLLGLLVAGGVPPEDAPFVLFFLPALWVSGALDVSATDDNPVGQGVPARPPPEQGTASRFDESTRRTVFEGMRACDEVVRVGGREERVIGQVSIRCLDRLAAEYGLLTNEIARINVEGMEKGWGDR